MRKSKVYPNDKNKYPHKPEVTALALPLEPILMPNEVLEPVKFVDELVAVNGEEFLIPPCKPVE